MSFKKLTPTHLQKGKQQPDQLLQQGHEGSQLIVILTLLCFNSAAYLEMEQATLFIRLS